MEPLGSDGNQMQNFGAAAANLLIDDDEGIEVEQDIPIVSDQMAQMMVVRGKIEAYQQNSQLGQPTVEALSHEFAKCILDSPEDAYWGVSFNQIDGFNLIISVEGHLEIQSLPKFQQPFNPFNRKGIVVGEWKHIGYSNHAGEAGQPGEELILTEIKIKSNPLGFPTFRARVLNHCIKLVTDQAPKLELPEDSPLTQGEINAAAKILYALKMHFPPEKRVVISGHPQVEGTPLKRGFSFRYECDKEYTDEDLQLAAQIMRQEGEDHFLTLLSSADQTKIWVNRLNEEDGIFAWEISLQDQRD